MTDEQWAGGTWQGVGALLSLWASYARWASPVGREGCHQEEQDHCRVPEAASVEQGRADGL